MLPCANPCRLFFERQLDKFVIRFGFLIHTYVCTHVQCVAPWINNVELGVKYLIYMYVPVESCCKVPFKFSKGETATCLGLKRIQELMMCSFICSWWKETRSGFAGAVGVEYKGIFIEKGRHLLIQLSCATYCTQSAGPKTVSDSIDYWYSHFLIIQLHPAGPTEYRYIDQK